MNIIEQTARKLGKTFAVIRDGEYNYFNYFTKQTIQGIYACVCLYSGLCYIGSSKSIERRIRNHLNELRKNKHYNTFWQNYVNSHGLDNFKWYLLECVNESRDLFHREQFYLDLIQPYKNTIGWNASKSAFPNLWLNHHGGETDLERAVRLRGFEDPAYLRSPSGEIHSFWCSPAQFARERKLPEKGLQRVLRGEQDFVKGWSLPEVPRPTLRLIDENDELQVFKDIHQFSKEVRGRISKTGIRDLLNGVYKSINGWTLPQTFNCIDTVVSPSGEFCNILCLQEFCNKFNLYESSLSKLVRGVICSYKGWTLPFKKLPERKKHRILDPNGVIHEFSNIKEFSLTHGLSGPQVTNMVNGKAKTSKGWRVLNFKIREITFRHTNGAVETTTNLSEFGRKYKISSENLSAVTKGRGKSVGGWYLLSINYK